MKQGSAVGTASLGWFRWKGDGHGYMRGRILQGFGGQIQVDGKWSFQTKIKQNRGKRTYSEGCRGRRMGHEDGTRGCEASKASMWQQTCTRISHCLGMSRASLCAGVS